MPVCPQCQKKYNAGDFSCPFCEVILEATGVFEKPQTNVPTMVELLLAQPGGETAPGDEPQPPPSAAKPYDPDAPTNPREVALQPVPDSAVIRILDVDLQEQSLSPYEAHFLAFIDRKRPARDIREAARLSAEQFATVVQLLTKKGVVEVTESTDVHAAAPPVAPAPLPTGPAPGPAAVGKSDEEDTPAPDLEPSAPHVLAGAEHLAPPTAPRRAPPADAPNSPAARLPIQPGRGVSVTRMKPIQEKVRRNAVPEEAAAPIQPRLRVIPLPPKRGEAPVPQGPVIVTPLERAIELEKDGKWQEAVEVLETAIRKARSPSQLYNRLAIVLAKYRHDFKESERLLNKAIEIEPDNSVFQQNLIKVISMAASQDSKRSKW